MMEMPLAMLPVGVKGKITKVHGGRRLVRRLSDMGFTPDTEVIIVHSHASHNPGRGGPLVVEIKDSRIALGRGIAMKIMIKDYGN